MFDIMLDSKTFLYISNCREMRNRKATCWECCETEHCVSFFSEKKASGIHVPANQNYHVLVSQRHYNGHTSSPSRCGKRPGLLLTFPNIPSPTTSTDVGNDWSLLGKEGSATQPGLSPLKPSAVKIHIASFPLLVLRVTYSQKNEGP